MNSDTGGELKIGWEATSNQIFHKEDIEALRILRDQIAIGAMIGILQLSSKEGAHVIMETVAKNSYMLADYMLDARKR